MRCPCSIRPRHIQIDDIRLEVIPKTGQRVLLYRCWTHGWHSEEIFGEDADNLTMDTSREVLLNLLAGATERRFKFTRDAA